MNSSPFLLSGNYSETLERFDFLCSSRVKAPELAKAVFSMEKGNPVWLSNVQSKSVPHCADRILVCTTAWARRRFTLVFALAMSPDFARRKSTGKHTFFLYAAMHSSEVGSSRHQQTTVFDVFAGVELFSVETI